MVFRMHESLSKPRRKSSDYHEVTTVLLKDKLRYIKTLKFKQTLIWIWAALNCQELGERLLYAKILFL